MNSKWTFSIAVFAAGALAAALSLEVDNAQLKAHTDKLKQSPSLTVTFTYNRLGTQVEDQKLILSKSGLLRWETPSTISILNGNQLVRLDRKTNDYTEETLDAKGLNEFLGNNVIWAWTAVIDPAFTKPITDAKLGAARKIKGTAVKELNVARGNNVVTFFVDDQLGFARGATYQVDNGGTKDTILVVASEIVVGKEPIAGTDKAFALPTGAHKVEKLAMAATFKDASAVLRARCGCHMSGTPAGLSLASYQAVMKGGRSGAPVIPGDSANSLLIGVIKGTKAPKMPPQGSLSAEQIATLEKWINDGAKE